MDMASIVMVVYLLVLLALIIGAVFLQIFLSKRESKWPGLILPGICLVCAVLMVCNLAAFSIMSAGEIAGTVLATFLLSNIPTGILLAIYVACREKLKKQSDVEKMNIQDL